MSQATSRRLPALWRELSAGGKMGGGKHSQVLEMAAIGSAPVPHEHGDGLGILRPIGAEGVRPVTGDERGHGDSLEVQCEANVAAELRK